MALKMEDRHSIIDILNQTPEIPEDCQWATFLRNHDELTLEMVTDEERDYMYKVYARDPRARINLGVRRRLAPLMENDRRQIELLNALLFSLPGSPIIYYGDEIGMGDNIYLGDRDGVRTPFQWSPDRNAGFSRANPQKLFLPVIASPEFHSETVNVETQSANPNSFYWWMRRLIALRRNSQELSRGKIEFVENSNSKVLSFTRTFEGRTVLCVFNLARSTQHVDLDLSRHKLRVPAELFAGNDFPSIGEEAYFLTLAPYSFMWFALRDRTSAEVGFDSAFDASRGLLRDSTPLVIAREPLQALLSRETWLSFESGLRSYLPRMRWFAGKDRKITGVELDDLIFVRHEESEGGSSEAGLAVLKVSFREGLEEHYLLGIAYAESERAQKIRETHPELIMAQYHRGRGEHQSSGIYYDAILDGGFSRAILFSALRGETLTGLKGRLECEREMRVDDSEIVSVPPPSLSSLEQSNCSVFFGRRFFLKLYRRVEEGESPEVEVGRYLTRKEFEGSAPLLSSLVYRRGGKEFGCGIIQRYLPNEMDGWSLMLDQLARIGETALTRTPEALRLEIPGAAARGKQDIRPPENLIEIAGYSLELASELGRMTASLHRALGSDDRDKEFIPEAFTPFHQRSLFQSFRNLTVRNLQKLRAALSILPERTRDLAKDVISCEGDILDTFFEIRREPIEAPRIRIHGDLQLGQVLFTGVHFRVIDFEGEPGRGIGERRLKRSPLKDVASMLRSFEYAAEYYLKEKIQDDEPRRRLRPVVLAWARWAESEYLHSYLYAMEGANLLPVRASQLESLLRVHVLEKALDEIAYELRSRPDWIEIPLRGVLSLVEENEQ